MESKQLTGPAYMEQFLTTKQIQIRQRLTKQLEETYAYESKQLSQHYGALIRAVLQDHDPKQLAGKRVNIGRTKPMNEDIKFLENYFNLPIGSTESVDIEEDTYGASTGTHKEYVVHFNGMDQLYSRVRELEAEIARLKVHTN
jgi:hypothetical protein